MNPISSYVLQKANIQALFNVLLYLVQSYSFADGISLIKVIDIISADSATTLSRRNMRRLEMLKAAAENSSYFADTTLAELVVTSHLCAAVFKSPDGSVSVCFSGTGAGEWIDNGEGLSGIPTENTYITYDKSGEVISQIAVENDYATPRQVEALNWFNRLVSLNSWDKQVRITVSGHSKGGNKAQFVAVCSGLVTECYSFDGQGFSPEALEELGKRYADFALRREKIFSISADNDYVNVLGSRLVPAKNIHYFRAADGLHHIDSILSPSGKFNLHCEQGILSEFVQRTSETVMKLDVQIRKYATLGIMNVFRELLGDKDADDADDVSVAQTLAGVSIGVAAVFNEIRKYSLPRG